MDSIKNMDLERGNKRVTITLAIIIVAAIIGFAIWVNQTPEETPVNQNTEQTAPAPQ